MHSDDPDYWCVAEALTPEKNCGASVCVSNYLGDALQSRIPISSPTIIPYGIKPPPAQTRFSDQPFRVVYSGRLVQHQKCIHQVVRTLIHACHACAQIEADLIGDGPERQACQRQVHQAGLTDRIRFLGRLPPEKVSPLLQQSQAILLMSAFEGLPLALLEAMACGVVPVVRTMASGIPELVHHEHTGLLVANAPRHAAAALLRLQRNPHLWQHCSSSARRLVASSYNVQDGHGRWLQLIERQQTAPRPARPLFPLASSNLRASLPLTDRRLRKYYPPPSDPWLRLHPRRAARRLLGQLMSASFFPPANG